MKVILGKILVGDRFIKYDATNTRRIGVIIDILQHKYITVWDDGLTIVISEYDLDDTYEIRHCNIVSKLGGCDTCIDRFYCYTNNV